MTTAAIPTVPLDERTYRRRIRAWALFDWANSAFATTILAAVLPVYYSQVAGATLPSEAVATGYWSIGLSLSLLISAILSPILGAISDIRRGKKRFLAIFRAIGIVFTGLLALVGTGDWLLASALFIFARIGFVAALTFYDSLLAHVARPEDRDRVSAQGFALGYLGGGILLAINIVMIQVLPATWGPRLSFLSVAVWWAVFSIPLFRRVPEPPSAVEALAPGESVLVAGIKRLWATLREIRRYRELFKFLLAFLIYSDAIGTIIAMAAIYGAELGLGTVELVLVLLLTQFVGIPFSLIFGRLSSSREAHRPLLLAFIVFNLVALPVVGFVGRVALPADVSGVPQPAALAGTTLPTDGMVAPDASGLAYTGTWTVQTIPAAALGSAEDAVYRVTDDAGARLDVPYTGKDIRVVYATGPTGGIWTASLDGSPIMDAEMAAPLALDTYSENPRYGVIHTFRADAPGDHRLVLTNTDAANPASSGRTLAFGGLTLPSARVSSLPTILGLIAAVQVAGLIFAALLGRAVFARLAATLDTRRSLMLGLVIYSVVTIWGFFLVTNLEFWFLAWMVAMAQGGTQALSRSLYASMSPAAKSGEFFGLYGIMEKFSSILGPLLFALAIALFNSSRPAILSLIAFFIVGGYLLTKVNIAEGQRIAREEDAAALAGNA